MPITVKVATVARAGANQSLRYSAQIEPATKVDMAFKVGGYVEAITKTKDTQGKERWLQAGDMVKVGQELAHLRRSDYAQKVSEAKAALAQARAGAEKAKIDYERANKLSASGTIAPAELDSAKTQLDSARAVADGAKARLDEAETALSDTTLRSPLKGVVTKRSIEVGTLAGQSTVAFSLADTETVKVLFAVPDTALSHVKLGSMQNVTTESLKDVVFQGRISRVSPVADQKSRAFEVEVTIANADGRLKPGMVAALGLDVGAKTETADLMVPLAAVVRPPTQRDKFGVFVATEEGGKLLAKLRAVEVGEFAGNAVSVKGGLKGGEKVVVMGAGLLSDGDAIGVVE